MHPRNHTGKKSLDKVAADPRVAKVWEEGRDGYWARLADGYNHEGCSCLHEWRVRDMLDAMKRIKPGAPC